MRAFLAVMTFAIATGCASQKTQPTSDSTSERGDAIRAAAQHHVRIDWIKEGEGQLRVRGNATSPENVGAFRKELEGTVVTPKGIGQVVEETESTAKVRLGESTVSVPQDAVRPLCASLDQKRGEQFSILNRPAIYNFELICSIDGG